MLKYLFTAKFSDGITYVQNPENVSTRTPGKSCFTDLLDLMSQGFKLQRFELSDGKTVFATDLLDGHFETLHKDFKIITSAPEETLSDFRPIYFFTNKIGFNVHMDKLHHEVERFVLGWQANDSRGNNVSRTMEIY